MKYDLDYFIKKFSKILPHRWTTGKYKDGLKCCALGHCGESILTHTEEARALDRLFSPDRVGFVNDGKWRHGKLGKHPRTRILYSISKRRTEKTIGGFMKREPFKVGDYVAAYSGNSKFYGHIYLIHSIENTCELSEVTGHLFNLKQCRRIVKKKVWKKSYPKELFVNNYSRHIYTYTTRKEADGMADYKTRIGNAIRYVPAKNQGEK